MLSVLVCLLSSSCSEPSLMLFYACRQPNLLSTLPTSMRLNSTELSLTGLSPPVLCSVHSFLQLQWARDLWSFKWHVFLIGSWSLKQTFSFTSVRSGQFQVGIHLLRFFFIQKVTWWCSHRIELHRLGFVQQLERNSVFFFGLASCQCWGTLVKQL